MKLTKHFPLKGLIKILLKFVAKANDIHLPDNLTLTYPLPPDASGKDTDNMDPVVMETPAVSDASAGLSAINNGEYVEPSYMQTKPLNHLQKLLCKVKRVIFHA